MTEPKQRPRVRDIEFHLYGRSIHPELLEILHARTVETGEFRITLGITTAGHVLAFEAGEILLTEITSARQQPLPQAGQLLCVHHIGSRSEPVLAGGDWRYHTTSEREDLSPALFEMIEQEIVQGSRKGGLLYRWPNARPGELRPCSYLSLQASTGVLSITALHTFPREHTILKTISLLERVKI
jgi:hypothetical protein